MKTLREKIEVMQAHENGGTIEVGTSKGWSLVSHPNWAWDVADYRIKADSLELYLLSKTKGLSHFEKIRTLKWAKIGAEWEKQNES